MDIEYQRNSLDPNVDDQKSQILIGQTLSPQFTQTNTVPSIEFACNQQLPNINIQDNSPSVSPGYIHWTKQEIAAYQQFVNNNLSLLLGKDTKQRRKRKIFIEMSQFIGTKNDTKCRSFHQKYMNKHRTFLQAQLTLQKKEAQQQQEYQLFRQRVDAVRNETIDEMLILSCLIPQAKNLKYQNLFPYIQRIIENLNQLPGDQTLKFGSIIENSIVSPSSSTSSEISASEDYLSSEQEQHLPFYEQHYPQQQQQQQYLTFH